MVFLFIVSVVISIHVAQERIMRIHDISFSGRRVMIIDGFHRGRRYFDRGEDLHVNFFAHHRAATIFATLPGTGTVAVDSAGR